MPVFHATTAYKQWLRAELEARQWSFPKFRAELSRRGTNITTQAIGDFFGPKDETPTPSNIWWMPAANAAVGIAAPYVCDPTSPIAQLRDQWAARWASLSKKERNTIRTVLGLPAED